MILEQHFAFYIFENISLVSSLFMSQALFSSSVVLELSFLIVFASMEYVFFCTSSFQGLKFYFVIVYSQISAPLSSYKYA